MAKAARLEVTGGRELRKTLKAATGDLKDMRAANLKAAQVVLPRALALVPRRSGALARTIRAGATARAAVIRAGSARVPYANVQEWGWARHNIPSQPYLTPAARETEPAWTAVYRAQVQTILDKVKGAPGHG